MLQPKNVLMKRGNLLDGALRMGRKVFATIGFFDFAFGISVVVFWLLPRHRFGI